MRLKHWVVVGSKHDYLTSLVWRSCPINTSRYPTGLAPAIGYSFSLTSMQGSDFRREGGYFVPPTIVGGQGARSAWLLKWITRGLHSFPTIYSAQQFLCFHLT